VMIGLIFAELQAYVTVTTESKVVLDHLENSKDDTLQVRRRKFKFKMLSCEQPTNTFLGKKRDGTEHTPGQNNMRQI